jgi:hypothetical protein
VCTCSGRHASHGAQPPPAGPRASLPLPLLPPAALLPSPRPLVLVALLLLLPLLLLAAWAACLACNSRRAMSADQWSSS